MIWKLQQNTSRYGWTWLALSVSVTESICSTVRLSDEKNLCSQSQRVWNAEKKKNRLNFTCTAMQFWNSTVSFERVSWFVDHETCSTYKRPHKPFKLNCLVCTWNDPAPHAWMGTLYFALISNILLHFSDVLAPSSSDVCLVCCIIFLFRCFQLLFFIYW